VVSLHSCHAHARWCPFNAPPYVDANSEEVDIADAERVLADLVSKSRFIEITSEESDEVNKEGAVPRLDEMGPRPEEGQASEGGSATCAHDVDEAALHA